MLPAERKALIASFGAGLVFNIILYILLTVMRDMRDNFEVEIWHGMIKGKLPAAIYTQIDAPVSLCILMIMSLLIVVRQNLRAFQLAHLAILLGFVLIGVAATLYYQQLISPYLLMYGVAFGLYLAYVPYSILFFERLIALFRVKGNVGFLIYLSDSIGYTGTITVMLIKQFGSGNQPWGSFFIHSLTLVSFIGMVCIILSYRYFMKIYGLTRPAPLETRDEGQVI